MQALAAHPDRDAETILFQILTESSPTGSDEATSAKKGDGSRQAVQQEILSAVGASASEEFRLRLAQHAVDPATPLYQRRLLGELVLQPSLRNLSAQVLLCRDSAALADTKKTLDEYFVTYSREALRQLLGFPRELSRVSPGRASRGEATAIGEATSDDPELPARVAQLLWDDPSVEAMVARLRQLDSLNNQIDIIGLASSIPRDRVRAALYETLELNWQDGPTSLNAAGLFDKAVTDPGFVVLIKMLPRGEPTPTRPAYRAQSTAGAKQTGQSPLLQAREARERTEFDWLGASAVLLLSYCERLDAAAPAHAATSDRAEPGKGGAEDGAGLPLSLHEDARVVARYDAVWPDALPAAIPKKSVSTVELHYVRVEEKNRFKRMCDYYRRQLRGADEHVSARGLWLDLLDDGSAADRKRSVDVFICPTDGVDLSMSEKQRLAADEERLTIDVLSVEIHDPTVSP